MDSLTLFGHLFKTRCEAICIFLDFFTEKRGSHREIYDFFEKVTKRIAFARNFRYTVTRIAPATCGFCALLPKQLTPRQGTKTDVFRVAVDTREIGNNSHPARGRKPVIIVAQITSHNETTHTPPGDENHQAAMRGFVRPAKQLTPRQGTKTRSLQC